MALSPQQATTLVAALRASVNTTVVAALQLGDAATLLNWCNQAASPAQKAWLEAVPSSDVDEACDWTQFDVIQAGKRDSWGFFLSRNRDFSKNKIRKWVTDIWGNATSASVSESILQAGTVNMSNAEAVFGGADATTGTVTAKKRTWVGPVGQEELGLALARNP
jgi:hypothetical protein